MSTANKKLTLQTLFFTHDVITSSNYIYLSLQTHQLSAISAVIGNRFTIVVVVVVVDINSPNVGTPRLRVEQIINLTIRTKVLM